MSLEVCKSTNIHEDKVAIVKSDLEKKDFSELLIFSKCLSDSSRIKILYALKTYKEMCVCDLAAVLNASIATTSHHLQILKKNGMLQSKREGKEVYYSLTNETILSVMRSLLPLTENVLVET